MKPAPFANLLKTIESRAAEDAALTEAILAGVERRLQPLASPLSLRNAFGEAALESLVIVLSIGLASLVFLASLAWLDVANGSLALLQASGAESLEGAIFQPVVPSGLFSASAMARFIGNGMWAFAVPSGLLWFALRVLLIPVPGPDSRQEETPCGIR